MGLRGVSFLPRFVELRHPLEPLCLLRAPHGGKTGAVPQTLVGLGTGSPRVWESGRGTAARIPLIGWDLASRHTWSGTGLEVEPVGPSLGVFL